MIEVDVGLDLGTFKLDVAFADGQGITALSGQSGSGKSLTLNLIAGLLRQIAASSSSTASRLSMSQNAFSSRRIAAASVWCSRNSNLFPHMSVKQNLLYGRWFAPKLSREIEFDAVVDTLGIGGLLRAGRRFSPAASASASPSAARFILP